MDAVKLDGGPAFPVDYYLREGLRQTDGMTLRDYFAARMAAQIVGALLSGNAVLDRAASEKIAANAYGLADDLLKERAK